MRVQQLKGKSVFLPKLPIETGLSLPELTATVAVTGILAAIIAPSISFGRDNLKDSGQRIEGLLKLARVRATSKTSAYKISPKSDQEVKVEFSNSCDSATWTDARGLEADELRLDEGVSFSSATVNGVSVDPIADWSVCFDSRGSADNTLSLTLLNTQKNLTQQIQVFRGGTVSTL